ncbi:hypothetical protein [Mesorhizobium sp. NZP2234]|uniref:hypothetical protein n=1 Tax=Mesorhizobium sp. NZP2234 TaxID=2483402 RepID=UPI001553DE17|nr:hypothetical protein [Mesorhizobium sp. NZP2234]
MRIDAMGTAALGEAAFDAAHPVSGAPVRVLAVNDDDPQQIKWLVGYTDGAGNKRVETVDAVAPRRSLGRRLPWTW